MFRLETRLFSGVGSTNELINEFTRRGFTKVLVLIDKAVSDNSEYWLQIRETLTSNFQVQITEIELHGEPTYDFLDSVVSEIRELQGVDVLIGIGGGSILDIAKAVAVLITNPGSAIEYRGFDKVLKAGVPCVCIPTTAGTGSEVTINAVFTDSAEMKKLGINGNYMAATYAVLDAKFTESCPFDVALSSGLDALVHTLESFSAKQSTPITRMLSLDAFRLIYNSLETALNNPEDEESRQQLLLGSYFAGAALFNSGSGISGALSYPIGVHFRVPHGFAGGITLPSIIKFNIERGWFGYSQLLDAVEFNPNMSSAAKSALFHSRIIELYTRIKAPSTFDRWKITLGDLNFLNDNCKGLQAAFDQNPVSFSATSDVPIILKQHIGNQKVGVN